MKENQLLGKGRDSLSNSVQRALLISAPSGSASSSTRVPISSTGRLIPSLEYPSSARLLSEPHCLTIKIICQGFDG